MEGIALSAISLTKIRKVYKIYKKPLDRILDSLLGTDKYEEYVALKDISFEVNEGEVVGILGKNGAGKSTLLKIITGVVKPTAGEMKVNGKISAILELNSGFDEELSGYENIFVKGLILGYTKDEMMKKVDEIIEFADIGKHINQPVRTYSSGMKSRLGFAIAVNVDPDILIVDEALSVGDDIFKTKCLNKMSEFRKAGKTILFVSHSLFTVKSFCTKCVWIKDGVVHDFGDTEDIVRKYESYLKEEKGKQIKLKKDSSKKEVLLKKDYIEVSEFEFNGKSNKFKFGEDLGYSFNYEIKKPMKGLKWSFTIRDIDKKEIYSSNKMNDTYSVEDTIGKHSMEIALKNIRLMPGKYLLSGELRDETGIMYVGYANKKPFEVVGTSDFGGSGVWYIEHEKIKNT